VQKGLILVVAPESSYNEIS